MDPDMARKLDAATLVSKRALILRQLHLPIAICAMILGAIFGGLGVLLVYLGAKGNTQIKLFGQSMETTDVGVGCIFIGAIMVIVIIQRLFKSADSLRSW